MRPELRRGGAEWLLLLALSLMWGTGFAFITVALRSLPPVTVVWIRLTVAALVLLAVQLARGIPLPRSRSAWASFALVGFVGDVLPFCLIGWGLQVVDSGTAGILMATMPLCTLVLARLFVAGERLTVARTLGFALGFAGVVVLVGPEALRALGGEPRTSARQLAVLAGAVCYSVSAILVRRIPPTSSLVLSTCTLLAAAAMMLPVACLVDRPWELAPSFAGMGASLWLGLVPTALATLAYFHLIASAGPTFSSLISYLIPPIAVLTGVLALGERLSPSALAALGLILVGLALGQRR